MARHGPCLLVMWSTKPVPIKKEAVTKFIPVMEAVQTWDEKFKSREKWERKPSSPHNEAQNSMYDGTGVLMK
ncbi:MAG: hypothetical protein B0W54_10535 [Cellvibrio sp. 79]|nr:MAG: hypothetical protein B0W54_10535 [Cellvibrio sp. 79]